MGNLDTPVTVCSHVPDFILRHEIDSTYWHDFCGFLRTRRLTLWSAVTNSTTTVHKIECCHRKGARCRSKPSMGRQPQETEGPHQQFIASKTCRFLTPHIHRAMISDPRERSLGSNSLLNRVTVLVRTTMNKHRNHPHRYICTDVALKYSLGRMSKLKIKVDEKIPFPIFPQKKARSQVDFQATIQAKSKGEYHMTN